MIDQAIRALLVANSSITALVATRVYQSPLPQSVTLPAISFSRVSTPERLLSHSGPVKAATATFQISAWAEDVLQAKNLAALIRQTLHGFSGTQGGEKIYWAQIVNEVDFFDIDLGNQVAIDISITHKEL